MSYRKHSMKTHGYYSSHGFVETTRARSSSPTVGEVIGSCVVFLFGTIAFFLFAIYMFG